VESGWLRVSISRAADVDHDAGSRRHVTSGRFKGRSRRGKGARFFLLGVTGWGPSGDVHRSRDAGSGGDQFSTLTIEGAGSGSPCGYGIDPETGRAPGGAGQECSSRVPGAAARKCRLDAGRAQFRQVQRTRHDRQAKVGKGVIWFTVS